MVSQFREGFDHEACTDQEHQRHGRFADHHRRSQPVGFTAGGGPAAGGFQRVVDRPAQSLDQRGEAEEDSGQIAVTATVNSKTPPSSRSPQSAEYCPHQGRQDHFAAQRRRRAGQEAHRAGQQQSFETNWLTNVPASGTHGATDGDFALARFSAGEQEIRYVAAGDEEHEADGGQHRIDSRADVTNHLSCMGRRTRWDGSWG